MDEPTPILRADATDDDIQYESVCIDASVRDTLSKVVDTEALRYADACGDITSQKAREILDAEENQKGQAAREPGTVEEPKRLVPVVVSGVLHGYREE